MTKIDFENGHFWTRAAPLIAESTWNDIGKNLNVDHFSCTYSATSTFPALVLVYNHQKYDV